MKLAQVFKSLKQMEKKDPDLFDILTGLFQRVSDGDFSGSNEIQVSKDFWGYDWIYFKNNTNGKTIAEYDFYEKRREISESDGQNGVEKFSKKYTEVYDSKVYESHLNRLEVVSEKLNKMGFKTRMVYSKNYKKCTLKNGPAGIWLQIKW